ncbi:MAG: hypothetical protein R2796_01040 [Chitinophagaceae bacterium]|nr:hypothetical protein [Chitinophagaceae bacterium]
MKKIVVLMVVVSAFFQQPLKAQYYYYNDKFYDNDLLFELGVKGGVMNALTDLGGKKGIGKGFIKDLRWRTARPSYGFYGMLMYKSMIGVRLEGSFGEVAGYDSILKKVAASTHGRYERNLSFKSKINEIQLAVEFHPITLFNFEETPRYSPYILGGIGWYHFDPQAKLNGIWYALQPLSTEGQGFAEYKDRPVYKLTQMNYILGAGIMYDVNHLINARLEFAHRILKTDYLDDVSTDYIDPTLFVKYLPPNLVPIAQQLANRKGELDPTTKTKAGDQRGDPKDNDSYFTIELKIGITLGRQRR